MGDFNKVFQQSLEMPSDTPEQEHLKFTALSTIAREFTHTVSLFGRTILDEFFLEEARQTIQRRALGGIAGGKDIPYAFLLAYSPCLTTHTRMSIYDTLNIPGDKYIVRGMLLKLARDSQVAPNVWLCRLLVLVFLFVCACLLVNLQYLTLVTTLRRRRRRGQC